MIFDPMMMLDGVGDKILEDVGNLHVWRKTVVTTEEIPAVPAGYTLGDVETDLVIASSNGSASVYGVSFQWASSPTVDSGTGEVSLGSNPSGGSSYNITGTAWTDLRDDFNDYVVGNFCLVIGGRAGAGSVVTDLLFVPSGSVMSRVTVDASNYQYNIVFSKARRVTGHPYTPAVPAGTVTTYPVSTSANAYQEKDITEGVTNPSSRLTKILVRPDDYIFSANGNNGGINVEYSSSITVSSNSITLDNPQTITMPYGKFYDGSDQLTTFLNAVRGKYISVSNNGSGYRYDVRANTIYYIGEDCNFSTKEIYDVYPYGYNILADKAQICVYVEGVPAGTSIEYLNFLGNKTSRQILTYTGTGTYGDSFPTIITFNFKPKFIFITPSAASWNSDNSTTARFPLAWVYPSGKSLPSSITNVSITVDGLTATIVSTSASGQCNISDVKYYVFAIG